MKEKKRKDKHKILRNPFELKILTTIRPSDYLVQQCYIVLWAEKGGSRKDLAIDR